MKRRTLKSLSLNKKSISSLNLLDATGGRASSNSDARTNCMSCTRSCRPDCKITLPEETCEAQGAGQQQRG
ncbi:MAG: hypothetical protein AAF617_07535 [Bacteroidota bacterium]